MIPDAIAIPPEILARHRARVLDPATAVRHRTASGRCPPSYRADTLLVPAGDVPGRCCPARTNDQNEVNKALGELGLELRPSRDEAAGTASARLPDELGVPVPLVCGPTSAADRAPDPWAALMLVCVDRLGERVAGLRPRPPADVGVAARRGHAGEQRRLGRRRPGVQRRQRGRRHRAAHRQPQPGRGAHAAARPAVGARRCPAAAVRWSRCWTPASASTRGGTARTRPTRSSRCPRSSRTCSPRTRTAGRSPARADARSTRPYEDARRGAAAARPDSTRTPATARSCPVSCTSCARRAKILSLRVLHTDGFSTEGALLLALNWLARAGRVRRREPAIDVVSMSLGFYPETTDPAKVTQVKAVIERLTDLGVLVVAAAGNDATTAAVPAGRVRAWHRRRRGRCRAAQRDRRPQRRRSTPPPRSATGASGSPRGRRATRVVSTVPVLAGRAAGPSIDLPGRGRVGPWQRTSPDPDDLRTGLRHVGGHVVRHAGGGRACSRTR